MDNKIEERFPWLPVIQRGFFESFSGDYKIGLLEQLKKNIAKEIQNIECKWDLKTAKHLLKGVEYFYYHFCRIWNYQNKVYPYFFEFSSHLRGTWVYLLSSFIKICLLLSRGKESKWIGQAMNAISRFPGDKNLIYDALLFVHSLKNKYKPAYGAILESLLIDMPLFVPLIIDDPLVFLKLYLLVRRLKLIIKDRTEKAELQLKVSKIMAPPSLWDWLLDHDFIVPWTKKGAKKVNLGINICRKLGCNESQVEIVKTLRKILLPGLCTERKVKQGRPGVKNFSIKREYVNVSSANQDSSEDDKENVSSGVKNKITGINCVSVTFTVPVSDECKKITADERKNDSGKRKTRVSLTYADPASENDKEEIVVNEKVKCKKLKRGKKKFQEKGEEGISISRLEMQKLNGTLKDTIIDSEENVSLAINHSSTINTFDDGELISEEKDKKKQTSKNKKQQNGVDNCDSEGEPKIKKRRQREKIVSDENPDGRNTSFCDHSLLEDISQIAKITKNRRMQQKTQTAKQLDNKSKETDFIDINGESDAEDLSVVVDEIFVDKSVSDKRVFCLSKRRTVDSNSSCSVDDQPVILKEVKHYLDSGLTSSYRKKKKNTKIELKSKFWEKNIIAENIFTINSEPSHCLSESGTNQIAYNEMYNAEQKDTSSCGKPENISNNEESLNSSDALADLQDEDLPVESNSKLKITDHSHDSEDIQGSCESNSSPFRSDRQEPFHVKEIRTSSGNQTSLNENDYDCKSENGDNAFSSIMKEQSGYAAQTVKEFSQESAVQTEGLIYSPNQTSRLSNNCIKYDPASKKLMDRKENISIWTDFEKKTIRKTNISHETVPILESCGSPVLGHFSLNSESSAQKIEMRKDEYPSIESGELISVINKVDFSETNHVISETTENNAEVIVGSGFPFENSSCNFEKDKITQESIVSESSIDSLLHNTYSLKTGKISSLSAAKTVNSECVYFNSPKKVNIERMEDNCSIKTKSGAPLENPASSLVENKIPLQFIPINNNSFQEMIINEEKLTLDSSLQDKIKSEIVSETDSNSSFEVDNLEVKKGRDGTCNGMQRQFKNNSIDDQSKYQITGLFLDGKSIISKPEGGLLEDTERSPRILDLKAQNLDSKAKNNMVETPNTSAAKVMIESMLKFAEFSDCGVESIRRNINKGGLTSALKGPSVKHLSKSISSAANEKPTECLSFLDISAENAGNLKGKQNFSYHTPEISEFLQYRDSSDQDDNRSEDTLSESKSISKTNSSYYPSDASNDTESEECKSSPRDCISPVSSPDVPGASNFKNNCDTSVVKTEYSWGDAITRQRFCQGDKCVTWSSQDIKIGIPKKNLQLKGCMLNPVVNLGGKCDKSFIGMNSSKSSDSLSNPTNSSVLPDIKFKDKEINETRPLKSNQASLSVDQLLTPVNETAGKREATKQLTSNAGKYDDVKEICLIANKELAAFSENQESFELTDEKELSQDHKATGYDKDPKLTICDKDQVSVELTREKEVSQDNKITVCDKGEELTEARKKIELSLGVKLREKPIKAVRTEKSMPGDEGSRVLNQGIPVTHCMNLRNRNPSTSSNQGMSAFADEDSIVLNQDGVATLCMNLRSTHSSMSSSQGKSVSASEDSNVLNQDTAATHCINLRSRNPSISSIQEVMGHRSQALGKRSSKRLKKDVNLNLGFEFSELSLNSPKALRGKPNDSIKNSSEVAKDKSPARDKGNSCRWSTRASVISSTVDTSIKEDTGSKGYNLRSRKSVIMPGKLKF